MSQYIVLRGIEFEDLTGRPPFFRGSIRPGDTDAADSREGWVVGRVNGEWQELPDISGLTEDSLAGIEAFRIYLH
jgi:hypothetical protein